MIQKCACGCGRVADNEGPSYLEVWNFPYSYECAKDGEALHKRVRERQAKMRAELAARRKERGE